MSVLKPVPALVPGLHLRYARAHHRAQPTDSAATVEQALLALGNLNLGDVSVTKLRDGVFGIDFRGAYAGLQVARLRVFDPVNNNVLAGATVRTRVDGIEYWGTQTLTLDLGSGNDLVIVQATDDETTTATINTLDGADEIVVEALHTNTHLTATTGTGIDLVVVRGTDSTVDPSTVR